MSWRCSGDTNEELVANLKEKGILKTEAIIHAYLAVDRKFFLPESLKKDAYKDNPLRASHEDGFVHQSAPHMYVT